jgi:hypothetical protein
VNNSPICNTTASAGTILIKKKLLMAVMTLTYIAKMSNQTAKSSVKSSAKLEEDVKDYLAPVGWVCGIVLHNHLFV